MNIYLSDKHGVNPSMLVCFWCGKEYGVALHGKLPGDAEAPRRTLTYDPCDECQKYWDTPGFVTIIEATQTGEEGQPDFHGAYPTGSWCVVTESAIHRHIVPPDLVEHILRAKITFMEPTAYKAFVPGTV